MSLKSFFAPSDHIAKKEFDDLLDQIYQRTDFFAYITAYREGKFYYTSPSIELITGYTVKQYEGEGVDFYISRIQSEDKLAILKAHADNFKKVVNPEFDLAAPFILDMFLRLLTPDGSYIALNGVGLPLAYLPDGGLDFALCVAYPQQKNEVEEKKLKTQVNTLLTKAKMLHNSIYGLPKLNPPMEDVPVEIVSATSQRHILTIKEKEVLKKIAEGKSSKEIAHALSITENTVETHRKNMLQKFEAKNIAELVKKASKLYWLD